jgi:hypothetical protein
MEVDGRFVEIFRLHFQDQRIFRARNQSSACHLLNTLVSCSAYSSTLKMKATCSSENSVDFQGTARRYIPADNPAVQYAVTNLQIFLLGVFVYTLLYFSQVQVGICLGSLELHYVH